MAIDLARHPPDADDRPPHAGSAVKAAGLAAGGVALAAGARALLDPYLQDYQPFTLFLVPVLVAAWFTGWRGAVVAVVLGGLAADYLFIHPRGTIGVADARQALATASFVGISLVGILLVERVRSAWRRAGGLAARLRAEAAEHARTRDELRRAKTELERHTAALSYAHGQLSGEETARRAAEARSGRLAALVASSEDAIVGLNPDAHVTDWNAGAERLFGLPAAAITGRDVLTLVPPHEREQALDRLKRLQRGESVPPYEAVRLRGDGTPVLVSVRVSAVRDDRGRATGFSLIYRDLTEARRLEEQFRQAQKMEAVGQLAGGVAHDFNNVLTVITGYAELLLDQLPPGDPHRDLLGHILDAANRAAALTHQLLAFSRKQVLQPRVVDLNETVRDTGRLLRRLIGEDVRLATTLDPALGHVTVDPRQFEQVILNLAVNARDAMPTGGTLTLATANVDLNEAYAAAHPEVWPGRYVRLAVSDTGMGMDAPTRARVFEPFFTTKDVGKGTGLGLAVVHGIVRQSGGHVAVDSEPGRGTTFHIYLPAVEGLGTAGKSHPGDAAAPRGAETVLLVEDDDTVRAFARAALEALGYAVLEAAHGGEAVRVAEGYDGPIHLLVSDVVMPEMGGRVLAERLTASRPGIRVLFVSGYTDDAVVRHGVREAGVAFLQKPFTPGMLARKVREVLDHRG